MVYEQISPTLHTGNNSIKIRGIMKILLADDSLHFRIIMNKKEDPSNNLTVLVAEDDPISYALIKESIDREDMVFFIHAKNGKEAVEKMDSNPQIELVLMDIRMPEMDGHEATRIIKKKHPTVPVIAQTAFASRPDRKKAFDAGCDEYISKPFKKKEFFKILDKLLKNKKIAYK